MCKYWGDACGLDLCMLINRTVLAAKQYFFSLKLSERAQKLPFNWCVCHSLLLLLRLLLLPSKLSTYKLMFSKCFPGSIFGFGCCGKIRIIRRFANIFAFEWAHKNKRLTFKLEAGKSFEPRFFKLIIFSLSNCN